MPEIIDPVFAKTSPKRSVCMSENERFGLVSVKTGSINSGTGHFSAWVCLCSFFITCLRSYVRMFFRFFLLMYVIQYCFICHPSDSTVSEDAGIKPRIIATLALTARRSNNHSAINLIHDHMCFEMEGGRKSCTVTLTDMLKIKYPL